MPTQDLLSELYWSLERVIDPGVTSSQDQYGHALQSILGKDSDWLDLGCGHAILPDWISGQEELVRRPKSVTGFDYDWASLTKNEQISRLVAGDVVHLPFREGAFSLVTANMVVEHLTDPLSALKEVWRILRPGGRFLFHTTNRRYYMTALARMIPQGLKNKIVWFMERRAEDDVFPTHYRMNEEREIKSLAQNGGFEIEWIQALNTSSTGQMMLGPLVVADLLWRRTTRLEFLRDFRSNYLVLLKKK